ncbi:LysR family transcriptional regulator [Burkholderia thailandensis]|uniref:LysR substrate binding domain protein n=2 Tax=Burkholderia thailandensis TaxID=57975 RepID=A0AAW9D360_BURTH|nr:LysR family transcriptional regulator [Burkholderia thailandensis]ABC38600.1 transcriptional regulator [Burkholderia thailandensis E264]AHI66014.1 bacterial regulatory helix-turn-helix, lysR family protein [Burkholderia thailandensis H0587]AHI72794.1 bacterial regulatory helix-turn-helix, lysR family protein [Burkholderia thailandensis 2002721723]AHI78992.1 bacterial regulatory helix-turn-helix, lysR family protein [Burkholderia thailandensis E444]AIC87373.1 bacterial regulatory helix-turn-
MDTLQNMRVFVRVVDAGSFTAAAQQLNTTTAYASRAVSDLEAHLRTRLLNRTTRRIALTEAGERYLQRCEQILAYVEQAEAEASDAHARPSGKLKVHCMTSLGQHYTVPAVSRYRQRYPEVQVDLTLAQRLPDLLDEGFDVSLVVGRELPDSGLVSQRLGETFSVVCASRGYIETHGAPQRPQDLAGHVCLGMVAPGLYWDEWKLMGPHGEESVTLAPPPFRVNVAEALAAGIREGMGIGVLPLYSAIAGLRHGDFVRVMPEYRSHVMNIYALYASRQYLDAKIRTWVDFLRDELPSILEADEAALERFTVQT